MSKVNQNMDSLQHIKDTAAQWVARRHGVDWTPADAAALEVWLDTSMGHRVEYLCHEKTWRDTSRLKVLGAGTTSDVIPSIDQWQASPYFKHVRRDAVASNASRSLPAAQVQQTSKVKSWLSWAAAALFLLTCGAGYMGWSQLGGPVYSTATGITTAVPLPDGSKVTLNTDSEIRLAVTEQVRAVELKQGEAFFEVVPDPMRPFVVTAGQKRIVVLGTKFSVRRDGNSVRIIVTEGKVKSDDVVLTAGAVANTRHDKLVVEQQPLLKAEALLSWREGYLLFDEVTLAEAVAEFNRYNTHKFVIQDAAIADVPVTGHFRSTSVEPFARLLEEGFPVKVTRTKDRIILAAP